jgi:hypothetical protein
MSEQNDNFTLAFNFAQRHRQQLAQVQRVLDNLNGQALGRAVVEAFGASYDQQAAFAERVDIRLRKPASLHYAIFYGHVLDLTKSPGFTITLCAAAADKPLANQWHTYLDAQPWIQQMGATKLAWFSDELLMGKGYAFTGSNLAEFIDAVREALLKDWQPQEETWANLLEPPIA